MLELKGEDFRDILIAVISKTQEMGLVTRNTEDFSRIPGLEILGAPLITVDLVYIHTAFDLLSAQSLLG